jgi:NAD(P)-dependent dehydrogenase (short-subunit alcohol dehydrogenase family)
MTATTGTQDRITLVGETKSVGDVMDYFRLDGQVALVTGASSGIGRRLARVLHAAGAHVTLTARREDRLKGLVSELSERADYVVADLSDQADMESLVDQTLSRNGKIDILVNNAGLVDDDPHAELDLQDFADVLDINLVAPFYLSKLVARSMLERGSGSIINIASVYGAVAATPMTCVGYTSSKGGVINLTRELGVLWAPRGVRVNAIAPGFFPTEMNESGFYDEGAVGHIHGNTPVGRAGHEHELDAVTLFLAGSGASYITGQTIFVDGGWTAR